MNNEDYKKAIEKKITSKKIIVKDVMDVNHDPHPYTIGPKHVAHAHDHNMGRLDESVTKRVRCAHPGCTTPYDQHKSDKVCFLQFTQDIKKDFLQKQLKKLIDSLPKVFNENAVQGFAFVEGDGIIV